MKEEHRLWRLEGSWGRGEASPQAETSLGLSQPTDFPKYATFPFFSKKESSIQSWLYCSSLISSLQSLQRIPRGAPVPVDIIGKLLTNPGQGITSATALEPFYIGEGFTAQVPTIQCNDITNAISPKAHCVLVLPFSDFASRPVSLGSVPATG